ncbi:adenylyltransferase/cytidyltransferase family protein [Catenovulum agarivorans]|uniref:adenylyltransferase/cytidyltransferase family protein n=1 Tax=Catenovulum agarivorans TaxID=1172192 RepID=UPI0004BA604D|nr:adenylyltransferase/cytidyltransferase family protein [Catenovulum agarivorans]
MKHNNHKVLALGVFDLFHVGHLNFLNFAREQGDKLLVGVAPDAMCLKSKGKLPIIEQTQRMAIIQALAIVDEVTLVQSPIIETDNVFNWMLSLDIATVVSGIQWQNSERWNKLIPLLANHNINVAFAPETPNISSSLIKHKISQQYCREKSI